MREFYGSPSERFLEEFGEEGVVPVRYAIGWKDAESASEWFERAHHALDVVESLNCSIDDLFEWSHGYRQAPEVDPCKPNERAPFVINMMQGGLTLRQIARWLEEPEHAVVQCVVTPKLWDRWPEVIEADERLYWGAPVNMALERETGLYRTTLRYLLEKRGDGCKR